MSQYRPLPLPLLLPRGKTLPLPPLPLLRDRRAFLKKNQYWSNRINVSIVPFDFTLSGDSGTSIFAGRGGNLLNTDTGAFFSSTCALSFPLSVSSSSPSLLLFNRSEKVFVPPPANDANPPELLANAPNPPDFVVEGGVVLAPPTRESPKPDFPKIPPGVGGVGTGKADTGVEDFPKLPKAEVEPNATPVPVFVGEALDDEAKMLVVEDPVLANGLETEGLGLAKGDDALNEAPPKAPNPESNFPNPGEVVRFAKAPVAGACPVLLNGEESGVVFAGFGGGDAGVVDS